MFVGGDELFDIFREDLNFLKRRNEVRHCKTDQHNGHSEGEQNINFQPVHTSCLPKTQN